MKILITLISFLFVSLCFAQTEEQRKYIFPDGADSIQQLIKAGQVNGLTAKKHSDYVYVDIYLDTDDLALYKNNLSLRIRKRDFGDGTFEFGMQLKSEMLKNGDVRMEVEEDELNFYQIVLDDKTTVKLQDELQVIFERFQTLIAENEQVQLKNDSIMSAKLENVSTWIKFKLAAAIAPFQKLAKIKNISQESLQTLKPVLIGQSKRQRVHIYIDRNNTIDELVNFPASARDLLGTPAVLRGEDYVWTMEASFDSAKFYLLSHQITSSLNYHGINEFEVENKYLPHENSKVLLEKFEAGLILTHGAQVNLESKFKQSINGFLGN